jgi:LL-diaminopimelate aminotransferase
MVKLNPGYERIQAGYLFPEIGRRVREFQAANPDADIIKLGIGDVTEPLTSSVATNMSKYAAGLGTDEGQCGYEPASEGELKQALSERYGKLGVSLRPSDFFISDGAKSDSANIQDIFHPQSVVAVQDPAYPVYVDTTVLSGKTGEARETSVPNVFQYDGLLYMPCTPANNFAPTLPEGADLIYICSPNNPTGAVSTHTQLKEAVDYANKNNSVIVFDAAYSSFIRDDSLPRSIYEIEGAKNCAIEINSLSKEAGFTGVRLGWSIVPEELTIEGTEPGKVNWAWNRRQSTKFNGACNVAQIGGLAALADPAGQKELVDGYMANADIIKPGLEAAGFEVYGGENAPYVWMKTKNDRTSWEFFDDVLTRAHVVGTPGSGFGPSGEGFFRLSAFGKRENIEEAVARIQIEFGQ